MRFLTQAKNSMPAIFLGLSVLTISPVSAAPITSNIDISQQKSVSSKFDLHKIIIKFKKKAKTQPINTSGPTPLLKKKTLAITRDSHGLSSETINTLQRLGVRVTKTYNHVGISSAVVFSDVGQAIENLWNSGLVEYVEPDYIVKATAVPNDPFFSNLWGLHNTNDVDIDAPGFWNTRKTAMTSIVGVIDTGIDYNHEDLNTSMWINPGEIASDGIDNDNNGYIDDIYGINTVNGTSDPLDDAGHGTHVAGTIGARGNNNKGITGVSWRTRLMAIKFLDSSGSGATSGAIEAINYAIAMKIANNYGKMILNNSWGGAGYSQALYDAIKSAKNNNILFIAASGNDGVNTDTNPHYPSAYDLDNIISVGANNNGDQLASFSNYGCSSTDVIAPGEQILSTTPSNTYSYYSGTSMATPHVSGIAALLWSHKTTSWRRIKAMILNGSEKKLSYSQKSVTQGRVNLPRSLSAYKKPAIFNVSPASAQPGDTVTIKGQDFGSTTGTIKYNGTVIPSDSWSPYKITFTLPTGFTVGIGSIKVTKSTGVTSPAGACFSIDKKPMLIGQTLIPRAWATSSQPTANTLWIFGGRTPWINTTGLVERIHLGPNFNTTSTMQSNWTMPTPVSNAASASAGSNIFIFGGLDAQSNTLSTVQIFDTVNETWSLGADLPQPLSQATATTIGDKIVVVGGNDISTNATDTTYIYNTITNTWTTGANIPENRSFSSSFRHPDDSVWVLGGFSQPFLGSELKTVYRYDLSTNSWTTKPSLNVTRGGFAAQYIYKAQVIHGSTTGEYEVFNGVTWIKKSSENNSLYALNSAKRYLYLYSLNGYDLNSSEFKNNITAIKP